MLKVKLANLKLAYVMRDWDEINNVLQWLEVEGYLEPHLLSVPLDKEKLKLRLERTQEARRMGLVSLSIAYKQRDWGEIGRVVNWLEANGHIG